jgi:hypothetical protein
MERALNMAKREGAILSLTQVEREYIRARILCPHHFLHKILLEIFQDI